MERTLMAYRDDELARALSENKTLSNDNRELRKELQTTNAELRVVKMKLDKSIEHVRELTEKVRAQRWEWLRRLRRSWLNIPRIIAFLAVGALTIICLFYARGGCAGDTPPLTEGFIVGKAHHAATSIPHSQKVGDVTVTNWTTVPESWVLTIAFGDEMAHAKVSATVFEEVSAGEWFCAAENPRDCRGRPGESREQ